MAILLIEANGTDVIWVESDSGAVFGIADSWTLLDCDGLKFDGCLVANLEDAGFDILNDYDNERWVLKLDDAIVYGETDSVNVESLA